ncbi:hypothetical protein Q9R30_13735 [Arthrobacter sp. AB6]|uniref:hypothetical protein n=1 Tax=Arthrobacter sp. AB6 TaxID=2962570 RepID=UPI002881E6C5|nr:hypothetical protein [Arthrobacter sp. AB6]MDT0196419.1 hypothetical protein [Arthrobacter sp. AB6]
MEQLHGQLLQDLAPSGPPGNVAELADQLARLVLSLTGRPGPGRGGLRRRLDAPPAHGPAGRAAIAAAVRRLLAP